MPKIKGGVLLTAITGRVGDTVYGYSPARGIAAQDFWRVTRGKRLRFTEKKPMTMAQKTFKYCDAVYQQFTEAEKQVWRNAVKKRGMSGYNLWMKESMALAAQGFYLPDVPSPSGGYAT